MTIDEIRKKAPVGATHYIHLGHVTYHKYIGAICYEITETGNTPIHLTWYHQLKPSRGFFNTYFLLV